MTRLASHRPLRFFVWVLRAVLFALALQLGGVVHGAADLLAASGVLAEEHEQCPPDGACDDCLPGCPNCHCAAALRTVAPVSGLALEPKRDDSVAEPCARDASSVPLGPTLDSVYRPPRADVRLNLIG